MIKSSTQTAQATIEQEIYSQGRQPQLPDEKSSHLPQSPKADNNVSIKIKSDPLAKSIICYPTL